MQYMVNAKKEELIRELKELRKQKGITYQQIVDETEAMGCAVCMSTVKSVFSNSRNHDHDYNNVLKPIADVLMTPSEDDTLELKILQTRLELKNEENQQLKERIDNKEQKHKDREEFLMDQLEFYKDQIHFKDKQVEFKNDEIKRLNETIDRLNKLIRKILIGDDIIE